MSDSPQSDYDLRFGGIARLYGLDALDVFRQSHVAVIGVGGVGSWAAEALARSGIGKLTLIDMDDVCVSNVNRQIHALNGTIGQPKVEVLAQRLLTINPDLKVDPVMQFVTEKNLQEMLNRKYDLVIDAIDSVKPKCAIIAWCRRNKLPIICAGGAGGQTDPTQITTADLSKTTQDSLLAKVRHRLRREYNFPRNPKRRFGVECVYSTEQQVFPQADGTVCFKPDDSTGPVRLDCASGFGAATAVTASFGLVAASRALKRIIERATLVDER